MTPDIVTVGGASLILGDAAFLAEAHAGRAGVIVTDPPYRLTSGGVPKVGGPHRTMGGIFHPDAYDNGGALMATPGWGEVSASIARLAAPDCDLYVFANDKNVFAAQSALAARRLRLHNLLIWDKCAATPNRWYMKRAEFVLYMWKGRARRIANAGDGQIMACPAPRGAGKIHETEKPVDLLRRLIANSARMGETVYDPFAGSASTLVAAETEGFPSVGFEVDAGRFERAAKRLERDLGKRWA
ncbi:MAG: hypothetical protein DI629_20445 [Mesorhizobium amorphae]|nr:MAG: hypothetical protein DI629_20445 [Mesorhizobium amorphae]